MPLAFEPFFLPVSGAKPGQRFCIFHPASGDTERGAILYIHPFAEEMNKSRRMAAIQSRALAKAGFAVLQIDLLGCGDSSGDLGDAIWQDWIDDVVRGANWLTERIRAPLWLWGLRAGCLLATEASGHLPAPCNFLFWAPSLAGKLLLQQFLRLKAAGDMLGGGAKGVTERLRQQLASGVAIEVAGYMMAPELCRGMERSVLVPPVDGPSETITSRGQVKWFELSTRDDASLSPVVQKTVDIWRKNGFAVRSHIANGPAFWQTTEIEDAPDLLNATVAAMLIPAPQAQEVVAA
jgi:exosortase A-associated hydrolase 2